MYGVLLNTEQIGSEYVRQKIQFGKGEKSKELVLEAYEIFLDCYRLNKEHRENNIPKTILDNSPYPRMLMYVPEPPTNIRPTNLYDEKSGFRLDIVEEVAKDRTPQQQPIPKRVVDTSKMVHLIPHSRKSSGVKKKGGMLETYDIHPAFLKMYIGAYNNRIITNSDPLYSSWVKFTNHDANAVANVRSTFPAPSISPAYDEFAVYVEKEKPLVKQLYIWDRAFEVDMNGRIIGSPMESSDEVGVRQEQEDVAAESEDLTDTGLHLSTDEEEEDLPEESKEEEEESSLSTYDTNDGTEEEEAAAAVSESESKYLGGGGGTGRKRAYKSRRPIFSFLKRRNTPF